MAYRPDVAHGAVSFGLWSAQRGWEFGSGRWGLLLKSLWMHFSVRRAREGVSNNPHGCCIPILPARSPAVCVWSKCRVNLTLLVYSEWILVFIFHAND